MYFTKLRRHYFGNERRRVGDYFKITKMSLPLTRVRYNYATDNLSFFYITADSNSYEDFVFLNLFIKKRMYNFQLIFLSENLFCQQGSILLGRKRTVPIKSQRLYKVLLNYDRFINFYNKQFACKIIPLISISRLNTLFFRYLIRYRYRSHRQRKRNEENFHSQEQLFLRNRFLEENKKVKPKHKSIRVQFAELFFGIHDFIKNKSWNKSWNTIHSKRINKLQYLKIIKKKKLNDYATELIVILLPLNITIKK